MQAIAEGNNAFACDLFTQLRSEPGNLFFSPFSIHIALAMTADGARGETLDEMVKVLHLPKEAKARLAAGDVARFYALGGEGYELAVANNLWGQQGFPWKADFLERQRTSYGAELTSVDFKAAANRETARKMINASIEKSTRDKIKDLLKSDDLTEKTRLVLTNAIYFKGQWLTEFDKKATKDAPFTLADGTKKNMPLMAVESNFSYMETEEFQAVELPYKGKAISMVVLLPKKHDGMPALEKQLSAKELEAWIKKMGATTVNLALPKFKSENRIQLADVLAKKMGMALAFDPQKADLLGMATLPPGDILFISKVIHQSFVEVNEEGTIAAAATAVVVKVDPSEKKELVFRADHPFIYLIRDTKTGNILFLGRYAGS
jgi:serpin B